MRSSILLPARIVSLIAALLCAQGSPAAGAENTTASSTAQVLTLRPATEAKAVCPDTPLRLTFPGPVKVGAGKIQIVDVASGTVVDAIDVAAPSAVKNIGGFDHFNYYPIICAENVATIYPRNGCLAYNKTYAVKLDAGAFAVAGTSTGALPNGGSWQFTTKSAPPAADVARIEVAADGTGDFCTVQGALDFLPEGNTRAVTIFLRKGVYTEIVAFTERHGVTILGEDRKQTVIAYANNANFNDAGGNPFGGATPNPSAEHRSGRVYHRGLFLGHRVNDLTIANLTMRNTTPHGGSQAETIILNGTTTARAIITDVDLYSYQDTLQVNGQAYIANSYIEGDVDFMWGTGPCFFENVIARSVTSDAYYTQIRNPGTNHGYVYLRCTFDGAPGVTGNYLSRVGTGRFPHSEVVLIDCKLGSAANPIGWMSPAAAKAIRTIRPKFISGSSTAATCRANRSTRRIGSPDPANSKSPGMPL